MENISPSASPAPAPRSVAADRAVAWWTEAWTLFMKAPGIWIVFGLITFLLLAVLNFFIPLLGGLVSALILPVLVGSWMLAARKVEGGGTLELNDLFAAFKDKLSPLVVLGALLLGASVVAVLVASLLGVGAWVGVWAGGGQGVAWSAGLLGMLVVLAFATVVAMVFWYAPPLIVLRGVAPVDAAKASFAACLKNIVPFLIYSVIYLIASVIASLLFGLGWILLVPVLMLTAYTSYKDLFGD